MIRASLLVALLACTPAADSRVGHSSDSEKKESTRSSSTSTPEGVQQLLPRGGIPAIDNPRFVPASSANIPDDAWVLGVEIDGQARAYSLNLLNQHEVVNDTLANRPIAAVW